MNKKKKKTEVFYYWVTYPQVFETRGWMTLNVSGYTNFFKRPLCTLE